MILLDLDPNVVKPGWIPLVITIALGLVMVLLFRSMTRQFRRVDENFPPPGTSPGATAAGRPDPTAGDDGQGPDGGSGHDVPDATGQGRPIPR